MFSGRLLNLVNHPGHPTAVGGLPASEPGLDAGTHDRNEAYLVTRERCQWVLARATLPGGRIERRGRVPERLADEVEDPWIPRHRGIPGQSGGIGHDDAVGVVDGVAATVWQHRVGEVDGLRWTVRRCRRRAGA